MLFLLAVFLKGFVIVQASYNTADLAFQGDLVPTDFGAVRELIAGNNVDMPCTKPEISCPCEYDAVIGEDIVDCDGCNSGFCKNFALTTTDENWACVAMRDIPRVEDQHAADNLLADAAGAAVVAML